MTTRVTGTTVTASFDEQTYDEIETGAKLTRAHVAVTFHGGIDGTSTQDYLMAYDHHGASSFVGLERVNGTVAGRHGTFVLQHHGTAQHGRLQATWFVVSGSGTGELDRLRGTGAYEWDPDQEHTTTYTFEYDLD